VLALAYRPESYSHGSLGNFDKLPSLIHKNLSVSFMQLHILITKKKFGQGFRYAREGRNSSSSSNRLNNMNVLTFQKTGV
jgi:hypothetical protein